jgi:hypothetical protein
MIVMPDADMDQAVDALVGAGSIHAPTLYLVNPSAAGGV